jgi:hypothetical protein
MNKAKYWLPPLFLMALIFYLSSRQRVEVSDIYLVQFAVFKSLHVIEYAVLYLLNFRALKNLFPREIWKNHIDAFVITLVYAFSDEIHQRVVPTREGRMRDIVIDTLGITFALWYLWKKLPQASPLLKSWGRKLEIL